MYDTYLPIFIRTSYSGQYTVAKLFTRTPKLQDEFKKSFRTRKSFDFEDDLVLVCDSMNIVRV